MRRSKLLSRTLLMSANTLTKRFLLLIVLLLITYIPQLITFIPSVLVG